MDEKLQEVLGQQTVLMVRQIELLTTIQESIAYSNKLSESLLDTLDGKQHDNEQGRRVLKEQASVLQGMLKGGGSKEAFEELLSQILSGMASTDKEGA